MAGPSSEIIFEVAESPEGGYEARALSASIFTEADTLAELESAVRDAVQCHFGEQDAPSVIRLHIVRERVTNVSSQLLSYTSLLGSSHGPSL